jgi:hypothetical protein
MRTTTLLLVFASTTVAVLTGCNPSDPPASGQSAAALGSADRAQPPSFDALDSAIVDAVIYRYKKPLPADAARALPTALDCGDSSIDKLATQKLTTDDAGTEILLDQTDGDQVGGYLFSKADLEALAAKKTATIPAKGYSGFWWSDGSHYSFGNATCKLK